MNPKRRFALRHFLAFASAFALGGTALAQETATTPATEPDAPAAAPAEEEDDEIIVLTPFTVDASKDTGYRATQTLAGTRIATELADVGSAISVLTSEFLRDINGTNNESTLAYAPSTEVGGARGNFSGGIQVKGNELGGAGNETSKMANPNANTRVRGLTSADNTRNMFLNDIPWDVYNVGRVDLQRGPNSMLFGLGSPAGIINVTINSAEFRDRGTLGAAYDQFGSTRLTFDYNKELIDQQLAIRVQYLDNNQKFRQEPAFSDDTRYFAAVAFAPEMLNREGMAFTVNANYEKGKIVSNRPRYITPMDAMTRFFAPRNEGGANRQTANHYLAGPLNPLSPSFNPAYSEFFTYDPVYDVETNTWAQQRPTVFGSTMLDGTKVTSGRGYYGPWPGPFQNELRMGGLAEFAARSNLPFANFGGYEWFEGLQDSSVFDFYNKLIDGDNKREYMDWDVLDISIAHTFFDGKVGYNLAYFNQKLKQEQWAAMGWGATLHIDVNSYSNVLSSDPEALGGVAYNPNPNAGRIYASQAMNFGNPYLETNREAARFQAFLTHNFAKDDKSFLKRLLGEHRLTASVAREQQFLDSRSRRSWQFDLNSMRQFVSASEVGVTNIGDNFTTDWRYYLSGDVRSRTSAVGLDLPAMTTTFMGRGGAAQVWTFDNTWTAAASVDPGADWRFPDPESLEPPNPVPSDPYVQHYWRQAANPFNYQGWYNASGSKHTVPVNVITLNSTQGFGEMSAKDYLTVDAWLKEQIDDSFTAVWQAYLWDKAVVGTVGYRRDSVTVDRYSSGITRSVPNINPITKGADLDPARYRLDGIIDPRDEGSVDQTNWSVVAHLNRFLGDNDFIPINVSVLYNKGANAQPIFGRQNAFGFSLPAPEGETDEYGLRLSTKDQKYSLQITKYETFSRIQDATLSLTTTFVLEQMFGGLGDGSCANAARGFHSGRISPLAYDSVYENERNRLLTQVVPDWFAFEQEVLERWPGFVSGWIGGSGEWGSDTNPNSITCAAPSGFALTEDAKSDGWEFEFVANPLKTWRIAANASQMKGIRTNVLGDLLQMVNFTMRTVNGQEFGADGERPSTMGDMPIWWTGNNRIFSPAGYPNDFDNPGRGGRGGLRGTISPYGGLVREWSLIRGLDGQKTPELREWHFNIVSSYDFQSGALEGVTVGGGYRWEDSAAVGYSPMYTLRSDVPRDLSSTEINLERPYLAPSQGTLDMWLAKTFKLTDKLTWRVQLNVNNVFGRNELTPVSAGLDPVAMQSIGTIEPETVLPMRDGIMLIREGRSWTLSSTLEF